MSSRIYVGAMSWQQLPPYRSSPWTAVTLPSPTTCLGRPGSRAGSGQVQAVMLLPLCAPWNFYDLSPLFILSLSLSLFVPRSQVRERANPRSLQRQAQRRAAPAATSPMWMALQVVVPPVWPRISDPAQHLVARSWRD